MLLERKISVDLMGNKLFLAGLLLVLILSGCPIQAQENTNTNSNNTLPEINENQTGTNQGDGQMAVTKLPTVSQGDTVKVEYVGTFPDTGEIFDQSEGRGPLEFVAGAGQMIKGFDQGVIGMALNEEKIITIAPEDAYGAAGEGQEVSVPEDQLPEDINRTVGTKVYTASGAEGTIISVEDGIITVKFVHPLAGKTLQFWMKVIDIQKAGSA